MALISQTDLETKLKRSLSSEEVSDFNVINPALQVAVEKIIGSSVEDADESTRYFDGGMQHLSINPCTDLSSVKQVDDDYTVVYTYDTSDYTTEPVNKTLKTMLRHRQGPFMRGINNIAVAAKFTIYNDADTLAVVKNAMLEALATLIENSENIKRESIEGYSVEYIETATKDDLAPIKYLFPEV